MKLKNKTTSFLVYLIAFLSSPLTVFSENNDTSLEVIWPRSPIPIEGEFITPEVGMELYEFINYIYSWSIGIAGLLVFAVLLFGGIKYISSAGDPDKIKDAKKKITSALIGLMLVLSSFTILNTINPQLTRITPQEDLLKDLGLRIEGIDPSALEEPSCSFVLLYSGDNFRGQESIRMVHSGDLTEHVVNSIKGFREMTDSEVDSFRIDDINNILREIEEELKNNNDYENLNALIQSEGLVLISSFTRLEEFLIHIKGKGIFSDDDVERWYNLATEAEFPEETPDGREIYNREGIYYIQGSSCLVTPYRTSATIWGTHYCGKDLGAIHVPSSGIRNKDEIKRNIFPTRDKEEEEDIACLYVESIGEGGSSDYYNIRSRVQFSLGDWACGGDPEESNSDPCPNSDGIPLSDPSSRSICNPDDLSAFPPNVEGIEEGDDGDYRCPAPGTKWCCPPEEGIPYGSPVCGGSVTSLFGGNHGGIDIGAPEGTPVYAPSSGTVTRHYTTQSGGHSLEIEHAEGYSTRYVHLYERFVNEGDYVYQGEQIATVGGISSPLTMSRTQEYLDRGRTGPWSPSGTSRSRASGRSTGAHLHYEVIKNGERLDPGIFGVCGDVPCSGGSSVSCLFD